MVLPYQVTMDLDKGAKGGYYNISTVVTFTGDRHGHPQVSYSDFMTGDVKTDAPFTVRGEVEGLSPSLDEVGVYSYTAAVEYVLPPDPGYGAWRAYSTRLTAYSTIKTPSWVTSTATKKPKKGKSGKVTGSVKARDRWWDVHPVGHQNVTLQFRKVKKAAWKKVKTAKTTSTGTFKFTTKASKDGHYRVVYAGSRAWAGSASAPIYVDVR